MDWQRWLRSTERQLDLLERSLDHVIITAGRPYMGTRFDRLKDELELIDLILSRQAVLEDTRKQLAELLDSR